MGRIVDALRDYKGHSSLGSFSAQVDTAGNAEQAAFGSRSWKATGSSYIEWSASTGSDLYIYGGDFTIEFHLYTSSFDGTQWPFSLKWNSLNYVSIFLNSDLSVYTSSGGSAAKRITTTSPTTDTWHHIAIVRSGTTTTLYVDGVSKGTATITYPTQTTNHYVVLGRSPSGTQPFTGYIDAVHQFHPSF